ncbi:MAG: hypothetical protein HYY81_03910 [Deltaproteobacteria bacterium]|nr:hypothetical protein [Deltaproteobacteria bacterium]
MVGRRLKIVHYVNQFFGGIGGEDKADRTPQMRPGSAPSDFARHIHCRPRL